ncbi:MAG: 30S ribosomal protein S17P [Candidatus Methanofastidiosum methylothiophilum]|jgi:small subunit ribosomal protein S17|uniref:30S ribosomal protein S17 n=1 Tax=Candidatus Methanofastidiosum methylothiophilum TaxID=1705564 RepID=A0A150JAV6_9EURY|nr:MAG: 30S ribosomal protein S17P [Candidatus Methanofastidiosum methylthiophilus]MBP6932772.1 30S ribosomal protein S17 [Methanofastidiosum sp.]OQC52092.1 MAG: 30S ribosomal protein S17P [Euryarchaeota archaeon ADurb.Bin023]KYC56658.1 MAG: 30S ribosomal protein S17P [Candidatus Methanofastidiosum methylthiophilus]KYC58383.1 MAG: 30S ribosomal protein S17P [Candidatus Methanofastidiosum methylthiophilus]
MIGIEVKEPKKSCNNEKCPFHGTLPVRGKLMEGKIVSDKMNSTVVVKKEYMAKLDKYERFEKRSTKVSAHIPDCITAKTGDSVKIMECRPLSKTKKFVVVEVI